MPKVTFLTARDKLIVKVDERRRMGSKAGEDIKFQIVSDTIFFYIILL